jgi:hypothetical protein
MKPRVVSALAVRPYALLLATNDGMMAEVDLAESLRGPVFEPLRDMALFSQVDVDPLGGLEWPNGASLAPEAAIERVREATKPVAE